MASTNININQPAYERLRKLKRPGQSFSEVILEHVFPAPCANAGELLESLRETPPEPANPELMHIVVNGRGRKSTRRKK